MGDLSASGNAMDTEDDAIPCLLALSECVPLGASLHEDEEMKFGEIDEGQSNRSTHRATHGTARKLTICVAFVPCNLSFRYQPGGSVRSREEKFKSHGIRCVMCTSRIRKVDPVKKKVYKIEIGIVCRWCYNKSKKDAKKQAGLVQSPATPRRSISAPTTVLTPIQISDLNKRIKAHGVGQQGRTLTESASAQALLQIDGVMKACSTTPRSLSFDKAVKVVAAAHQTSPATLRGVLKRYHSVGELLPPSPIRLTRSDPLHPLFDTSGPPIEVETIIHRELKEAAEMNTYQSISTLMATVYTETNLQIPKSTMHKWLHDLGYEHGEKKLSGLKKEYSIALIRRFVKEYALALAEERQSTVLVWMDESYIHTGYCSQYSWFHSTSSTVPNRVRGSEKGKRLIIIHAMTRDGMLESLDGYEPSDNLQEKATSAAVVTDSLSAGGISPEDYHDTLNGEKFVAWLQNRLIPTFQAKYHRKKMKLVLDNAKYHHARGPDWIVPSKLNRPECGTYLRRWGYPSIVDEAGTKYLAAKFTADTKDGGPGVKVMQKVISTHLKSHPGINTTIIHQLMKDHKYTLLYTPQYESWLQPIELVWAQAKHAVARQARVGRTWQETMAQTKAALHGMTKKACADIINHTERLVNEWLESDEAGSLKHFKTLDRLSRATKAELDRCTDLNLPEGDLRVGDAEEE
jgi:transposase